jgi:hypothetical protein
MADHVRHQITTIAKSERSNPAQVALEIFVATEAGLVIMEKGCSSVSIDFD